MVATIHVKHQPGIIDLDTWVGGGYAVSTSSATEVLLTDHSGRGFVWATASASGGLVGQGVIKVCVDGTASSNQVAFRKISGGEGIHICSAAPYQSTFKIYVTSDGTNPIYVRARYVEKP